MDSFGEFFHVGHEPHMPAAVRLIHEVPEGDALIHIAGDIPNDREAPPIGYEFLNHLSGNARFELEEIGVKALQGDEDQIGPLRPGDQIDGIAVAAESLAIRRARENAYTLKIVGGWGRQEKLYSRATRPLWRPA